MSRPPLSQIWGCSAYCNRRKARVCGSLLRIALIHRQACRNMMVSALIHRKSPFNINRLSPRNFNAAVLFSCLSRKTGVKFYYCSGSLIQSRTQRPLGTGAGGTGAFGLSDLPSQFRPVRRMPNPSGRGNRCIKAGSMQAGRGLVPVSVAKGSSGLAAAMSGNGCGTVTLPSGDGIAAGLFGGPRQSWAGYLSGWSVQRRRQAAGSNPRCKDRV